METVPFKGVFVRLPEPLVEIVAEQVKGYNHNRPPQVPPVTMGQLFQAALEAMFMPDAPPVAAGRRWGGSHKEGDPQQLDIEDAIAKAANERAAITTKSKHKVRRKK